MALLHMYMNNPTAGAVDGTEISGGDETLPLTFTLDANSAENKAAKCAVRCDSGYQIDGDVSITFEGDSASKWQAAVDNSYSDSYVAIASGTWQSSITLANVADKNVAFWVKAESSVSENPKSDNSVDIKATGIVVEALE